MRAGIKRRKRVGVCEGHHAERCSDVTRCALYNDRRWCTSAYDPKPPDGPADSSR